MISNAKARAFVLVILVSAWLPGWAAAAGPTQERCVRLEDTQISGATCKGLIRNGCDHPVRLTVQYEVHLRRIVILPITAEGPGSKIEDAGTAKGSEQGRLAPGESRWFAHQSTGKGIEVAQCRVVFSYAWGE
ncbi:MAG: hypothetical protein A2Y95_06580 [Deltaproteobacteria bacterium RBG_13_65_10]|nr:MAG: hypothetical protein A2Y95_06580 [Deltaproteobacteria bacterium RBG_13_65_10]